MGWGLAGTGNSSAVAVAVVVAPQGGGGGKGVIFQEKKPPEAACWPDAGLLKRKGVTSNPRIQKKRKIQESICKNARPRNEVFGRFWNSRMLYLDFHPIDIFSRKVFLYNKALPTTLEGSRNFLGGTYSRLGCDETGGLTQIFGYIGKMQKGGNS